MKQVLIMYKSNPPPPSVNADTCCKHSSEVKAVGNAMLAQFSDEKRVFHHSRGAQGALEITPNGHLRSEKEIESISRKKCEKRQTLKKERYREFRSRSKERCMSRRRLDEVFEEVHERMAEVILDEEVKHRLHPKRTERTQLRKEAREILKCVTRTEEYKYYQKKLRQSARRYMAESSNSVEFDKFVPSDHVVRSLDDDEKDDSEDVYAQLQAIVDEDTTATEDPYFMETDEEMKSNDLFTETASSGYNPEDHDYMDESFMASCRRYFDDMRVHERFEYLRTELSRLMNLPMSRFNLGDDKPMVDFVLDVVCFIRILLSASLGEDCDVMRHVSIVGSAMYLFLGSVGADMNLKMQSTGLLVTFQSLSLSLIKAALLAELPQAESLGETIDGFLAGVINITSSPFATALRNLIVFLAGFHLFEKPIANRIFKYMGKPEGGSLVSIIASSFKDIATLIRCGEEWFENPSHNFVFSANPCVAALAQLDDWVLKKDYTYSGLPIPGHEDRQTYVEKLEELINRIEETKTTLSKVEQKKLSLEFKLASAKRVLADFHGSLVGSFRAAPLAFVVVGPPGIGKSHVLKMLPYIYSRVKGREFSPRLIYSRQGDFWEGYNPISHPYIHYSEIGKLHPEIAKKKGDDTVDEMLSVVDNLAYQCNMAFENKGKIYAIPELVLIDTNNADMNLRHIYSNPAAFRRRFIYVQPIVQADYAVGSVDGGPIDKHKAYGKGTKVWKFNVWTQTPASNVDSVTNLLLEEGSDHDLVDLLVPMMKSHIEFETKVLQLALDGSMFAPLDRKIMQHLGPDHVLVSKKAKLKGVTLETPSTFPDVLASQLNTLRNEVSKRVHNAKEKYYHGSEATQIREFMEVAWEPVDKEANLTSEDLEFKKFLKEFRSEWLEVDAWKVIGSRSHRDYVNMWKQCTIEEKRDFVTKYKKKEGTHWFTRRKVAEIQRKYAANASNEMLEAAKLREELSELPDEGKLSIETTGNELATSLVTTFPDVYQPVRENEEKVQLVSTLFKLTEEKDFVEAFPEYPLSAIFRHVVSTVPIEILHDYAVNQGMNRNWRLQYVEGKVAVQMEFMFKYPTVAYVYCDESDVLKVEPVGFFKIAREPIENWVQQVDKSLSLFKLVQFARNAHVPISESFWDSCTMQDIIDMGIYVAPYLWHIFLASWALIFVALFEVMFRTQNYSLLNLSTNRKSYLLLAVISATFGWYSPLILTTILIALTYSVADFGVGVFIDRLRELRNNILDGLFYNAHRVEIAVGAAPHDAIPRRNFSKLFLISSAILGSATIVGVGYSIYTFFSPKSRAPVVASEPKSTVPTEAAESVFSKVAATNEELLSFEKSLHCGQSFKRVVNKLDVSKWNVMQVPRPVFTDTIDKLCALALRNVRLASVYSRDGTSVEHVHLLGVCENYAVISAHPFNGDVDGRILRVSTTGTHVQDGVKYDTELGPLSYTHLGNDLLLVRLNMIRFKDITKFLANREHVPDLCANARIAHCTTNAIRHKGQYAMRHKDSIIRVTDIFSYNWSEHRPGMCGTPLCVESGNGAIIAAVHCAGSADGGCMAVVLDKATILAAIADFAKTMFCPMASESQEDLILEEPNNKSIVNYVEMHGANYFGKIPGPIIMPSPSKVRPTRLKEGGALRQLFLDHFEYKVTTEYGPPTMRAIQRGDEYYSPELNFARKIALQKKPLNRSVLSKCIRVFSDRICAALKHRRDEFKPWDVMTAINGARDDAYARAMDLRKSAGFGKSGNKARYMEFYELDERLLAEPVEALKLEVLQALQAYDEGYTLRVFFQACLKDEPRDVKKIAVAKTRVFCVSPLVNLIITRMLLGPIYSTMVENGELFCVGIGSDMHRDADDIYTNITRNSKCIIEYDYGNYDQTMPYEIGWAAGSVVYQVCKRMGYNERALKLLSGLVSDNMHPFIVLNKDVFELPGYQPSGKYGTAEDNSLRGVLMLMYYWYSHNTLSKMDFFQEVSVYVYGDDVLGSISEKCSLYFDNIQYSMFCERFLGLECTPASKGDSFVRFMDTDKMSFLKRKFVYHDELQKFVAPLDMSSLVKTLEWCLPSDSINPTQQIIAASSSVVRELYFHSKREQFESFRIKLSELVSERYNVPIAVLFKSFPTFDHLTSELTCPISRPVIGGRQDSGSDVVYLDYEQIYDSLQHPLAQEDDPAVKYRDFKAQSACSLVREQEQYQRTSASVIISEIQRVGKDLTLAREEKVPNPCDGMSTYHLRRTRLYMEDPKFRTAVVRYQEWLARIDTLEATLKFLENKRSSMLLNMVMESGTELVEDVSNLSLEEKVQNLRDVGGMETHLTTSSSMMSSLNLSQTDVPLSKFLERPVLIDKFAITLDSPFKKTYSLYSELLEDKQIRSKLMNYAYFKADIRVKISVSGTPFHQGKIITAWAPWLNQCPHTKTALNVSLPRSVAKTLSTMPCVTYIDIKQNEPVELEIPFLHPQPIGRLFNNDNSVLTPSTQFEDFQDMGELYVMSLNTPEAVSESATNPYVQIYAWFTNVVVTVPTGTLMTAESDEQKVGPIERFASSAARVFSSASGVVGIGPYAQASAMIATGISNIASHLGWSKPVLMDEQTRVKNEPFLCAANVSVGENSHKLTLDRKQEVTIDPSVLGIHEDELTISSLCKRECLLDVINWDVDSVPFESIWTTAVHPRIAVGETLVGNHLVQQSPMALAASYFTYWHGDITFRFDIVDTAFHKGKFAIIWEPNLSQEGLISSDLGLNRQYVYIVDIQEVSSFEIVVKWSTPQAWYQIPNSEDSIKSTGTIGNVSEDFKHTQCNGFLKIFPITALQAPLSKPVHINVFVRSERMHFNVMHPRYFNAEYFAESASEVASSVVINSTTSSDTAISKFHFGEEPVSLRSILKRYRTLPTMGKEFTSQNQYALSNPVYPPIPLVDSYNDISDYFLGHLRYSFLGMKGGSKYRVRYSVDNINAGVPTVVSLKFPSTDEVVPATASSSIETQLFPIGATSFVTDVQPGVEVEIPFYNTALWVFSQRLNPSPNDTSYMIPLQVRGWHVVSDFQSATGKVQIDYAPGEDFMLLHFLHAPLAVTSPPS